MLYCSVIARKRGNARGAKGAGHRRWERANWQQEEPSILDGRRRSSFGGTSRMMREYHVRICERLGVKLPGPTRHTSVGFTPTWTTTIMVDSPKTCVDPYVDSFGLRPSQPRQFAVTIAVRSCWL